MAYHCCSYALSDSSDFFHIQCTDQDYDQVCIDYKNLDDTLQLLLENTTKNWDNQDAFVFQGNHSVFVSYNSNFLSNFGEIYLRVI